MKKIRITVGLGSCGIASGADKIYNKLLEIVQTNNIDIDIVPVGCIGVCRYEPIVEVYSNKKRVTYTNVKEDNLNDIIAFSIKNKIVKDIALKVKNFSIKNDNFIKKQTRIALKHCGEINPEDIDEYIDHDGYKALEKCFNTEQVKIINILKSSLLRGRGGAGFPTGIKWENAYLEKNNEKYVICNADEGDPGAFMDRAILEGNPHSVIEALAIAMHTIGASKGYIYVRNEYPLAVKRIKIALTQAEEKKYIQKNSIEIKLGAGAFVCGEETALMASIEGKRGEPTSKPPFPTTSGINNCPTLINNVETLANIPQIILNDAKSFKKIGTKKSTGTKVFALGGKIINTGLVEVPIGTKLRKIIFDIGGGIPNNKYFKAAQTGGPSGGCIPGTLIDTKMDYEELNAIGSMMGSGGLIVMDEDNCMVDIAKYFIDFTVSESCGKCVPCRIGTKQLEYLLTKFTNGTATEEDLKELEELAYHVKTTSFCGLGASAPNPIISTLKYFKKEYISHINKKCPAKVCSKIITYEINESKCIGCGLCAKSCSQNAIKGVSKNPHKIDQSKCIKCGNCYNNCKLKAIIKK